MDDKTMAAVVLSMCVLLNGCASSGKSMLLGGAIGGALGAGAVYSANQSSQNTAVGLAIGAGIGSLIGYLAHKEKNKKADLSRNESSEDLEPLLTKPKIRSVVVPDSIEGNKYIKSHRVFILEDAGSWSKD